MPSLPSSLRTRPRPLPAPPPEKHCASLLLYISPRDLGKVHALLTTHGHLGYITVLDPKRAIARLFYPRGQEKEIYRFLACLAQNDGIFVKASPWLEQKEGKSSSRISLLAKTI